jgi:hypothetical protein
LTAFRNESAVPSGADFKESKSLCRGTSRLRNARLRACHDSLLAGSQDGGVWPSRLNKAPRIALIWSHAEAAGPRLLRPAALAAFRRKIILRRKVARRRLFLAMIRGGVSVCRGKGYNVLERRSWVPEACDSYVQAVAARVSRQRMDETEHELQALIERNREIHERRCINLNPATNVMNPKAEAVLAQGLGTRASLGYPGDKYEMGLEAVEQIEIIAAELAAEVFGARFVEIRMPSGAIANLYVFMARPGRGMRLLRRRRRSVGMLRIIQRGRRGCMGCDACGAGGCGRL